MREIRIAILTTIILMSLQGLTFSARESPSAKKKNTEPVVEKVNSENIFSNYLAVSTGTVRDGEQIPVPVYQDGTNALRSECHYLISPNEVPTALTYISSSGAFYIKSYADENGVAHLSLWQQSGTGEGVVAVGGESYHTLKKDFGKNDSFNSENTEPIAVAQMRALSEKLVVNYLVIAIRSTKP